LGTGWRRGVAGALVGVVGCGGGCGGWGVSVVGGVEVQVPNGGVEVGVAGWRGSGGALGSGGGWGLEVVV